MLDYDVELSIINQNYVQIYHIFFNLLLIKSKIKNHWPKYHNVPDTKQRRHLTNFDLYSQWSDGSYQSLVPPSMCQKIQNGVTRTDYAIDNRLIQLSRLLVVKIEPIPK